MKNIYTLKQKILRFWIFYIPLFIISMIISMVYVVSWLGYILLWSSGLIALILMLLSGDIEHVSEYKKVYYNVFNFKYNNCQDERNGILKEYNYIDYIFKNKNNIKYGV